MVGLGCAEKQSAPPLLLRLPIQSPRPNGNKGIEESVHLFPLPPGLYLRQAPGQGGEQQVGTAGGGSWLPGCPRAHQAVAFGSD